MEVFVTNIPQQMTDRVLRNHLQPLMKDLSIDTYRCQKPQQKQFGFLVFLDINDGNRFLEKYGETKASRSLSTTPPKILILNTPIYCAKSHKSPNLHLLQSLEKEKRDQKTKTRTVVTTETSRQPIKNHFALDSVSCGIWSYAGNKAVYVPYYHHEELGSATFGARSLLVKLWRGQRIEFMYTSIYNLSMEDAPHPSFTLQLWESPRFYEHEDFDSTKSVTETLISRAAKMNVHGPRGPKRRRVASLSADHAPIASICFVFRIMLMQTEEGVEVNGRRVGIEAHMHALQRIPGLPPILHQQFDSRKPRRRLADDIKALDSLLATTQDLPWRIKFQIRVLVSDGYLTPSQTIRLLSEFNKLVLRCDIDTSVATIRKFRGQIPYAGPETEAADLESKSLVKMLCDAEAQVKIDQEQYSGSEEYTSDRRNLAMIHHVKITPTATYLSGPKLEPMNRVLRKYPNHHEYFLRVQFGDEDGAPIRFNPRVSNDFIFEQRFKSVLRNGISIAGRKHDFLGFSHSSLRAQSCWFMAPFVHNRSLLLDRQLIKELGDFTHIRCPAKCAARIGQAFSETPTAVDFPRGTFSKLDEVERNGRVFSDGVGTISTIAMQRIWKAVPSMRDLRPTCFQIRFRGT